MLRTFEGVSTMRTATALLILLCAVASAPVATHAQTLPAKSEVLASMRLVNDYWLGDHNNPGDNQWARAAYFSGNMAMHAAWPDHNYRDYALLWSENHSWGLNGGTGTRLADNHCVGQTYIALYTIDPVPNRIDDITTCMSSIVNSSRITDWSWVDALYMTIPVLARLGIIHGDTDYFDKMYAMYDDTKSRRGLYDPAFGLWYRDGNYTPPTTTPNGQPFFWSRGNGWVIAAHAKAIKYLPANDPHRAEFIATLQAMAAALKNVQRSDGFWNVSLMDPNHFGGPETSGTAFFTYGIAWGINNGFLDAATYLPVVAKAWNGMNQVAVHPEGKLGYVQGPAGQPSEGQPVNFESTQDYGVGAFLLAGSEVYELAPGDPAAAPKEPQDNLALNNLVAFSSQSSGTPASNAADDQLWTRWSAQSYPQWIELEFDTTQAIGMTEVAPYLGRAYQFTVETKMSAGESYSMLVDRSSNTHGGYAIVDTFPPVVGRFVRLTVTGASGYTGSEVSVLDFNLYGNPRTGIAELPPVSFTLGQNYPNPFNPTTTIAYDLDAAAPVALVVFDVSGRKVTTLVDEMTFPGPHEVRWNGTDDAGAHMASGVYFYRLTAGSSIQTRKMILLK